MRFLETISANYTKHPEKVVLSDEWGEYNWTEVWNVSGRVYAYLKARGIGREEVVMIHLPRGARAVMVAVGVLRAGAAVTIVEGSGEFYEYVRKDMTCRLEVDDAVLADMLACSPLDGYEETDAHDLAYITYTTGTTGRRKGVMHEYGTLDRYLPTGDDCPSGEDLTACSVALTTTLHTGLLPVMITLANNAMEDIVPHEVFGDWPRFLERLTEKRIGSTYMSPMYFHRYGIPETPYLKYVSVSFEPVCHIFSEHTKVINEYGMTEAGTTVAWFLIDKPYDITPAGRPLEGFRMCVMDEDGHPLPDGEMGEVCVENLYCRGYLNQPEATREQFRDGWYHTRDLGKRMPDDSPDASANACQSKNYIIYGRMNDALHVNGEWIVALEIETVVRRVLGRESAYVKVFEGEGNSPVICLYTDFDVDMHDLRERLHGELPESKWPTDHVLMEQFEYNNGKVIRLNLKNPHE